MIGQRDVGGGMYITKFQKADRMVITKVKRWVHFLTSLNHGGTVLGFGFILHKLETNKLCLENGFIF